MSYLGYPPISPGFIDDTSLIVDGVIQTADIANSAITTAKIADDNVTTGKVADGAITQDKIADDNVTTGKVADGAITQDKIADDAITPAKVDETGSYAISELTISGTTALQVPTGTEAQRPTPANGMLRYNTEEAAFEGYANSEWGPITGGSGGSADFVASGSITNGQIVVLNSNGTVSTVSSSSTALNPVTLGTSATFSTNDVGYMSSVYDPDTGKIIIGYRDNTTSYPTAVVGTVSGTSITFGTPVVIESNQSDTGMKVVYDTAANKPVFLFTKYISGSQKHGQGVVGTVSGTTISFGTITAFAGLSTSNIEPVDAVFDSGNNKIVVVYNNSNVTGRGATAIVGTVSGTSISFGTPTIWNTTSGNGLWIAYDANVGKVLVGMRFQNTTNPARVGTVSGTSISFGSAVEFSTNAVGGKAIYDPSSQKILVVYADYTTSNENTVTRVATISGDTVSFGSKTNLKTNSGSGDGGFGLAYSPVTNSIMVSLKAGSANDAVMLVRATISGTQATYESPVSVGLESSPGGELPLSYDDTAGKFSLLISDDVDGDNGKGVVITETAVVTDAANYFGVAAEDISDSATGEINIIGGINEGQTGLTVNTSYFAADDGSLTTTNTGRKIGRGIASTKLLVDNALTPAEMNEYLGGLV